MRARTETLISQLGLKDRVSVTGWCPGERVRKEILKARALVLPSFAEGLPVVAMEALSLGRPVIASAIAGIPELVEQATSAWLLPPAPLTPSPLPIRAPPS